MLSYHHKQRNGEENPLEQEKQNLSAHEKSPIYRLVKEIGLTQPAIKIPTLTKSITVTENRFLIFSLSHPPR